MNALDFTVLIVSMLGIAGYGLWRLRLPLDVAAITLAGVAIAHYRRPRLPAAEPQVERERVPVMS